jgi:hypothetical protein
MWLDHHSSAFTLAMYVHLLPDDLPDLSFLDANTTRPEPTVLSGDEGTDRAELAESLANWGWTSRNRAPEEPTGELTESLNPESDARG